MTKLSHIFALAIVLVTSSSCACALAQSGGQVTYKSCQDGTCSSGCQTQNFNQGECLEIQGKKGQSIALSCAPPNKAFCTRALFFKDDKCTDRFETMESICQSCMRGQNASGGTIFFSNDGGALPGANFLAVCTPHPAGCQDCVPTITPWGAKKCTKTPAGYAQTFVDFQCSAVIFQHYNASSSCKGTFNRIDYMSGGCANGLELSCPSSSSFSKLDSPPLPLSQVNGQKRTIKLPEHLFHQ